MSLYISICGIVFNSSVDMKVNNCNAILLAKMVSFIYIYTRKALELGYYRESRVKKKKYYEGNLNFIGMFPYVFPHSQNKRAGNSKIL